jgi:hypothetical protein
MELTDYGRVVRRWWGLILAGTLVAALLGYGLALRSRDPAPAPYEGTARVVVNYVTPPGVAYIPTLSVHTATEVLSEHVQDRGALARVAAQAHVAASQVQQVSTAVDPEKPLITVQVRGRTPRAVAAVAQGLARYLVAVQAQRIEAQADTLSRAAARAVAQAQRRWLAAQAHYYVVCGCLAGQQQVRARLATLARLRAELDLLQASYLAALNRSTAVQTNPVPVGTVTAGSVRAVRATYPSPVKAVLPAAVLGLLLSIGLGALLDYRRTGLGFRVGAGALGPEARRRLHTAQQVQIRELEEQLVAAQDQIKLLTGVNGGRAPASGSAARPAVEPPFPESAG